LLLAGCHRGALQRGMVRSKGKAIKGGAALAKAIKTGNVRAAQSSSSRELNTTCLDFKAAAAVSEFTIEDRGVDVKKKAPTKAACKTVFAGESWINVEHRIRVAAVPVGAQIKDEAFVAEALSLAGFASMPKSVARRLMPRRPPWSFDFSSGRLHHREAQAFKQWLDDMRELFADRGGYPPAFEQNLQVWRQLWRVLERCDVAVMVVDARHPLLHLPPALVYHVACTLKKPLLVVLNKLDTVPAQDAVQWAECLRNGLPGIAGVTGYSKEDLRHEAFGPLGIGRSALIKEAHRVHSEALERGDHDSTRLAKTEVEGDVDTGAVEAGRIMLGLVGHPNVGKSSLVNHIMGGKVVSVKATPGHTKTLQTLVLDERTCLCDSPGVVFPRLEVPREVQIVGMLIPLAQVREPFSALRWVMEHARTPLHELLGLKPATLQQVLELRDSGVEALTLDDDTFEEDSPLPWSPMLLCVQFAMQRGMAKSGGPDTLRAGMEILERVLDGRVPYSVPPPTEFKRCDTDWGLRGNPQDESDGDESDYQVDDNDYQSEEENAEARAKMDKGDLVGFFGEDRLGPGSGSIQSRRRQGKKMKQLAEAEKDEAVLG